MNQYTRPFYKLFGILILTTIFIGISYLIPKHLSILHLSIRWIISMVLIWCIYQLAVHVIHLKFQKKFISYLFPIILLYIFISFFVFDYSKLSISLIQQVRKPNQIFLYIYTYIYLVFLYVLIISWITLNISFIIKLPKKMNPAIKGLISLIFIMVVTIYISSLYANIYSDYNHYQSSIVSAENNGLYNGKDRIDEYMDFYFYSGAVIYALGDNNTDIYGMDAQIVVLSEMLICYLLIGFFIQNLSQVMSSTGQ